VLKKENYQLKRTNESCSQSSPHKKQKVRSELDTDNEDLSALDDSFLTSPQPVALKEETDNDGEYSSQEPETHGETDKLEGTDNNDDA
jgi:hypothetical protein